MFDETALAEDKWAINGFSPNVLHFLQAEHPAVPADRLKA